MELLANFITRQILSVTVFNLTVRCSLKKFSLEKKFCLWLWNQNLINQFISRHFNPFDGQKFGYKTILQTILKNLAITFWVPPSQKNTPDFQISPFMKEWSVQWDIWSLSLAISHYEARGKIRFQTNFQERQYISWEQTQSDQHCRCAKITLRLILKPHLLSKKSGPSAQMHVVM
jgi:hypothetical protein